MSPHEILLVYFWSIFTSFLIGAPIGVLIICLFFYIYHDASLSQIGWGLGFERLSDYLEFRSIKKNLRKHERYQQHLLNNLTPSSAAEGRLERLVR